MTTDLNNLAWPLEHLGDALCAAARAGGLLPNQGDKSESPNPPPALRADQHAALNEWVEAAADYLGCEAEAVVVPYAGVEKLVRGAGPALLALPNETESLFLLVLRANGKRVALLAPDFKVRRVPVETVCAALRRAREAKLENEVNQLLDAAGVPKGKQLQARAAILRERLSQTRVSGGWILRLPPSASFWRQLQQAGLTRQLFAPIAFHFLNYFLLLFAWGLLGRAALGGQMDRGWLIAWAMLLLTAVPFHLLAVRAQGRFSTGAGALLKQRLLYGALRLKPEEIRQAGTGQFLGQIAEADAIETLALNGGFLALVAVIELVMAALILAAGAGGWSHVLLLFGYVTFTLYLARRLYRRRSQWTAARMSMTNELVERMVGHRTRIAQESRARAGTTAKTKPSNATWLIRKCWIVTACGRR